MDESTWRVSADTSLQAVLDDPACPPLLSYVLSTIHSWQVRNETTVRNTLAASQLMPQWVAALVALGAVVTVNREDEEEETGLDAVLRKEVTGNVTSVQVRLRPRMRWGEARVARTPADDPIVAACAVVWFEGNVVEGVRIVLTGVSSGPVWVADGLDGLVGHAMDDQRCQDAAATVEARVEPRGDYRGSAAYRRAMAGVLTRRALEACREQEVENG